MAPRHTTTPLLVLLGVVLLTGDQVVARRAAKEVCDMRAYSVDLRQNVLAAIDRGMPRVQAVATFGVALSTINCWLARRRTGTLTPRQPGRSSRISRQDYADLWAQLEANPSATLEMQVQLWNESHQPAVSPWILGRIIRRLGWTRRKRRWVPPCSTNARLR